MPISPAAARCLGIGLGVAADAIFGDPRRAHPVAGFGNAVTALEHRLYADDVSRGGAFVTIAVGLPVATGVVLERFARRRPLLLLGCTASATWIALGARSLSREGEAMAELLATAAIPAARQRLSHLCARDPAAMHGPELARASVESLAENASDAVVAPLLWAAVAGLPGVLGYRAVNTLDAMVGYRTPRYLRFGKVAARLDDLVNLVPARVTGFLIAAAAPLAGGSARRAFEALRRDGGRHPSPNAGRPEAAMAGALDVRLGGVNVYAGKVESRPVMGGFRSPGVGDLSRAVLLVKVVTAAATGVAMAMAMGVPVSRMARRGSTIGTSQVNNRLQGSDANGTQTRKYRGDSRSR